MESFTKMDIFFAVTTAAIVIITAGIALIVYRIVRFVRVLEGIATSVKEEAKEIRNDMTRLRSEVVVKGSKLAPLLWFAGRLGKRVVSKKLGRK